MNKKQIIFFTLARSIVFSSSMSFIMTLVNVGFGPLFLKAFFGGIGLGFCAILPLSYFVVPLLQKLTFKLIKSNHVHQNAN